MTNTELLAKIKAEIERLYDGEAPKHDQQCNFDDGYFVGIDAIAQFIDTLESEKPMNQDLEKELARFYLKDLCGSGKDEIPEATLHHNFPIMWDDLRDIARHFAEWGAEHLANSNDEVVINGHKVAYDKDKDAITMEEIPNDLEEAKEAYCEEHNDDCFDATGDKCPHIRNAFIAGAKWQKEQMMDEWLKDRDGCFWDGMEEGKKAMREQMMKEAVEGEIQMRYSGCLCAKTIHAINEDKFKLGDKVRIIIVKE